MPSPNLLDLYMEHTGTTEVPKQFHRWCCLALIAACVADRVFYRKFRSSRLIPNLFTLLLGPSACGKGEAVATMMQFATKLPIVGTYAGNTTAQYLLKALSKRKEDDDGNLLSGAKMFLVLEELAMNVGVGPIAVDFIKHTTGLYKGGDYPVEKGTITGGHFTVKDHCLNILIGTNVADAVECIPKHAIEGGFLGRVAVIHAKYDPTLRITRPSYPPHYDQLVEHLHQRFRLLTQYEGEFQMTTKAAKIDDHWYMQRPAPDDEAMFPTWKREHDLSLKLAMLIALCEIGPDDPLLIKAAHVEQAQFLVAQCHKAAPMLQHAAHQTRDSEHVEFIRRTLAKAGSEGLLRSALQRKLSPKGILKDKMDDAIATLVTEGTVTAKMTPRGGMMYYLNGRRVQE